MFKIRDIPKYEALREMSERIPEVEPGAVEAYLSMLKVSYDLFSALDAQFARHGLSRGRFIVMMYLFKNTEIDVTPAELAENTGVTRATMTGLLDGLEREGLLTREKHATDGRRVRIRLTPDGEKFLKKMLPDHFRRVAGLMAGLSAGEQKKLASLLQKVGAGIPVLRDP